MYDFINDLACLLISPKIIGPKDTTEPQAGLDSALRASSLAQLVVKSIITPITNSSSEGGDPDELLSYNPVQFRNASHVAFERNLDWLEDKSIDWRVVNGRRDGWSQRLGQECQPFDMEPPPEGLFRAEDVVIISNGRCAIFLGNFPTYYKTLIDVRALVPCSVYVYFHATL